RRPPDLNLPAPRRTPRAGAEATAFHEMIPGHHFQIALSLEREGVPPLERFYSNSGFAEGWALYAEQLAHEMGLYSSGLDELGRLSEDALRAARLVVDPGLHVLGWSRQQAIDYMLAHTAQSETQATSEIDRYIITPGQATAYMIGRLEILRVAKVSPVSWPFILGFAGVFAAASYAMLRMARGGEFRGWHPLADMAVSAAMISAVLYAAGPTGHLLYVVYLIAPLQAALYLGQTEAWQALLVNLTGFGLATAVRVSQGTPGWAWSAFAGETLVLALVSAALVPTLARFVIRLQAARSTLAQVERGDLTVKLQDEELDELGYLGASVNRTTGAIAGVVRQVQHQSQDLAAMAQQLAASAQELQAASQEISAAAERLTEGTSRQRQLIGHGRDDSEAAADVAAQLHARAQEAERQIAGVAQQAQRHGQEIARASELLVTLVDHLDQVSRAAGTLELGSREIGKLVDAITRIASQTDLLAL